jgi:thiopeptide-type bacteriocin biosynthesis protein
MLDMLQVALAERIAFEGTGWIQVNCTLFELGRARTLYVPWTNLRDAMEGWRQEGRFSHAFFMRKPPGLRLRFYGPDLENTLEPALVNWLERAERRNDIRSFRFAPYEPEVFRFGGTAGMAIAHNHFDYDSRIILDYEAMLAADQNTLPREIFSFAIMNDLFRYFSEDTGELWDLWNRLSLDRGGISPAPRDADVTSARQALELQPHFLETLSPPAARLLEDTLKANATLAERLHAATVSGRLTIGVRSWLVSACVFHWNRIGLDPAAVSFLIGRALVLLDPRVP